MTSINSTRFPSAMNAAAKKKAPAVHPAATSNLQKARTFEEALRALQTPDAPAPMTEEGRASIDARIFAERALVDALAPKWCNLPGHVSAGFVDDQAEFLAEAIEKLEATLYQEGKELTEEPWLSLLAQFREIRRSLAT